MLSVKGMVRSSLQQWDADALPSISSSFGYFWRLRDPQDTLSVFQASSHTIRLSPPISQAQLFLDYSACGFYGGVDVPLCALSPLQRAMSQSSSRSIA